MITEEEETEEETKEELVSIVVAWKLHALATELYEDADPHDH
jgi:hypothetical protein